MNGVDESDFKMKVLASTLARDGYYFERNEVGYGQTEPSRARTCTCSTPWPTLEDGERCCFKCGSPLPERESG